MIKVAINFSSRNLNSGGSCKQKTDTQPELSCLHTRNIGKLAQSAPCNVQPAGRKIL